MIEYPIIILLISELFVAVQTIKENMSRFSKAMYITVLPLLFAGCQLIPAKRSAVVSPTAIPAENRLPIDFPESTMSAITATPSAAPVAAKNTSSKKTAVPQTTQTVTATSSKTVTYDTSFDSLEVTNFPGQTQNATLTLKNKSNAAVMWYIKLDKIQSKEYPLNVNGTNEITGTIGANSSTNVSIGTMSTEPDPDFSTSFKVVFSSNTQVLATRTIKVTVHSPASDRIGVNSTDNADATITFKSNGSYGIAIKNTHGSNRNWSAVVEEGADRIKLTTDHGYFTTDTYAYTSFYFTTADRGGLTQAKIVFTYSDDNHNDVSKHTLIVHVNN